MTSLRFAVVTSWGFAVVSLACSSEPSPPPVIIDVDAALRDSGFESHSREGGCDGSGCAGDGCERNDDCASGECFFGGTRHFCTKACESDSDCLEPPYSGSCNRQGYCRVE